MYDCGQISSLELAKRTLALSQSAKGRLSAGMKRARRRRRAAQCRNGLDREQRLARDAGDEKVSSPWLPDSALPAALERLIRPEGRAAAQIEKIEKAAPGLAPPRYALQPLARVGGCLGTRFVRRRRQRVIKCPERYRVRKGSLLTFDSQLTG